MLPTLSAPVTRVALAAVPLPKIVAVPVMPSPTPILVVPVVEMSNR
jgi:hypothetical protein